MHDPFLTHQFNNHEIHKTVNSTYTQYAASSLNTGNGNKNLAIANRSRVSCAHSNVEGTYDNPVTLKSRLT